ncbi:MAG: helix-turn-helix domain-containing protein [Porcipelethomonas sp.]
MEEYTHEQIRYAQDTGMVLSVGEFSGGFTARHWHNGFEILYVTNGELLLRVGERDYILRPGGFAVINCKTVHSASGRNHCRNLLLQIPFETIQKNIPDIDRIMIRCICKDEQSATGSFADIKNILDKLENLYVSEHDCGYLLRLNSLVYEILYQLVMKFKTGADPDVKRKTERNIQRLGIVLQYVRQHYSENISLSDAASMVALNREYFARFFKKYMGMTFMEYVFAVRIERAYYDIVNTDYPLKDIAARYGFEKNYGFFTRKFREQYGCNPQKIREQGGKQ